MTTQRQMKILAADRPKVLYTYTVEGTGEFPFDMLRYDSASPASQEAVFKLALGHYASMERVREWMQTRRQVEMQSYWPPTVARWASFGWKVLP